MSGLRVPLATYRIQFSLNFRYVDGRDLVPYLNDLGISDLYSSPRFKARRGSPHAYDVANPLRINSELGTEDEFDELATKLRNYGMGLVLDIVPNHMAASHENPWWMDVLERGQASEFARHFDIDWAAGHNKVVLPVLGDLYGNVLENQQLLLKLDENGFFVRYYEHRFPVGPATYGQVVSQWVERIPPGDARSHADKLLESKPGDALKREVWELYLGSSDARDALDETLRVFNGSKGRPESFDLLDRLLAAQAYRLAYWRMAGEDLNYRRFFDITDLIGVRVEDPEVFYARHPEIFNMVQRGMVTGLRVDHIDGLFDPLMYLRRLQALAAEKKVEELDDREPPFYVIVEKILGGDEDMPREWPVYGTTGYDYLNYLNGLFVDPEGLVRLGRIYEQWTGSPSVEKVRYDRKKQVMRELFAGEVHALGEHLARLALRDRRARDLPIAEIVEAFVETSAWFPVYRTYIRDFEVSPRDRRYIEETLEKAERATGGRIECEVFAFLRRVLLLEIPHYEDNRKDWLQFVMRWQQFTGPAMAKGYEDTTCYVYNRLASQNDVGSDPEFLDHPVGIEGFHQRNAARQKDCPFTMNASSTHDTKRSEDVRARINVLSEMADAWGGKIERWRVCNQPRKRSVNGADAPDANEELLIYQTLVGAWPWCAEDVPAFGDRLRNYLQKALREGKTHSHWLRPDEAYENAVLGFVDAILQDSDSNEFLRDFLAFERQIAPFGALNALSQALLKALSPGVPDFYQGTELWDLSLVDPDNRRPVDFTKRSAMLDEIRRREAEDRPALLAEMLEQWRDGRIKLYVTQKSLMLRRDRGDVFLRGAYIPLETQGARARHVCAFARSDGARWVVAAAPVKVSQLAPARERIPGPEIWQDEELRLPPEAPARWKNVFTGDLIQRSESGALALKAACGAFPIALLREAD